MVNRLQKVLEDANIKLSSVVTDVLGVSGRAMLGGLIAGGGDDPAALATLAKGSLRGQGPELTLALRGLVHDHHRFLLRTLLGQVEYLEGLIAEYDARIETVAAPFAEATTRLESIPGLGARAAEVIVAEIGAEMTAFPTAGHLASWAGLCPGNHESAGKRRTGKTTKGEPMAADGAGAGGLVGEPHQGNDLQRDVPPMGQADGQEEGVGRVGTQDPGGDLQAPEGADGVP